MEGMLLDELIETLQSIAEDPAARQYRVRIEGCGGPLLEVRLRVGRTAAVVVIQGPEVPR